MAFETPLSDIRPIRLDTFAAIAGLIVAILLFPLRFVASQVYIDTVPLVVATGCILYLVAAHQSQNERTLPVLAAPATMILPSVVIFGLASLILTAVLQGARTSLFYGLASVVGTLIVAQILFSSDEDFHPGIVLLQIVLFAAVFRFMALYTTPEFVGMDVWTHMTQLSPGIYTEQSLGGISHDKHFASPFYHLLVVATSMMFDVPLQLGLYLSLGVVMPLSVLLVYAAANLLVPSRWATLATALFAMASYVSLWGIHLIPTSMGLVFFLGLVYALIRVMRIEYTLRDFTLLILLSIAIILTHQVSTFIALVVLLTAFVAQLVFTIGPFGLTRLDSSVFRTKKPVNLIGLVVFNFGLAIFVWSLTPFRDGSFLEIVLEWFGETLEESAGFMNLATPGATESGGSGAEESTTLLEQVLPYINELGFLLLLGATLVGCLYVVHRRRAEQSVFTLLLGTGTMLVFVLGLPMFGIRNFIPSRWFAFLFVMMAILGAIGLRALSRDMKPAAVVTVMLLVALVYPGAMIVAAESQPDSPIFGSQEERLAYEQSELAAIDTVGEMTGSPTGDEIRPDQELHVDVPYVSVVWRTGEYHATNVTTVPDQGPVDHDYVLYRTAQSNPDEATYFRNEGGGSEIRTVEEHRLCRPTQSTVYDNGDVRLCTPSPADG